MPDNRHIDIGCAITKFSFIVCRNEDSSISKLEHSSQKETILAFFYIILDLLYQCGTVAAIDIRDYADVTLESLKLAREKS